MRNYVGQRAYLGVIDKLGKDGGGDDALHDEVRLDVRQQKLHKGTHRVCMTSATVEKMHPATHMLKYEKILHIHKPFVMQQRISFIYTQI